MTDILYGKKVILRPIEEGDTDYIVAWRNKDRIRQKFFYRETFTPEGHRRFFEERVKTGLVIQFMICEKGTNRPVGTVFLQDIDREGGLADYGFLLGEEDAVGRGYGGETIDLVKLYAGEVLKLKGLTSKIMEDNTESVQSCTRHGARILRREEGVACSDGQLVNVLYTMMDL